MQVIPNETDRHTLKESTTKFLEFMYTMTVYCTSFSENESSNFDVLNRELKCTQFDTLFNSQYRVLKVIW